METTPMTTQRKARPLIFALSLLLTAVPTMATSFSVTIENHPLKAHIHRPSCETLFTPKDAFEVVESRHDFNGTKVNTVQTRTTSTVRSAHIDPMVNRLLDDWVDDRDFTPDQKKLLWGRDQSLDPRRTRYIHLETDGHAAMLRIFDGSNTMLFGGTAWHDASESDSRAPIELNTPGFILPEHRSGKPFWELSLLNVDRHLKGGVETLLNYVGDQLDLHYNNSEWRSLRRLDTIAARDMVIYAQTRANRVDILKRYGFVPVMAVNSRGEAVPFEVSKNLVLMTFRAEDFVKRYHQKRIFAETKSNSTAGNPDREERERAWANVRDHIAKLESEQIPIRNTNDAFNEFMEVFKLYMKARLMVGGWGPVREKATVQFFERYYRFINSIPAHMRAGNWLNLRNGMRELMFVPDPATALYQLARATESGGRRISQEDFNAFYNNAPEPFRLGSPTSPEIILSWPTK